MRDDREGWVFPSPHLDSGTGHGSGWTGRFGVP
jgi:hypothetical protein